MLGPHDSKSLNHIFLTKVQDFVFIRWFGIRLSKGFIFYPYIKGIMAKTRQFG